MKVFTLKMDDEIHKRLKIAATTREMTMQEFINAAIEMAIEGTEE